MNPNFFTTAALDGHYTWSGPNNQMSAMSSQQPNPTSVMNPVMESVNQGDLSLLEDTTNALNYSDRLRSAFNQSWQAYEQLEMHRHSMAIARGTAPQVIGTPAVYATTRPSHPYPQAGRALPQGAVPVVPQPAYLMPQPILSFQAPTDTQNVSNIGLNGYLPPPSRSNPQLMPADAAAAIAQQRRRQAQQAQAQAQAQAQNVTSNGTTAAGQPQAQASAPNTRRRARRADDPGLHHSRRPSPPRYEGGTSQAAAVQYSELANPAARNYAAYSMLTPQQRGVLSQRLQLENIMRLREDTEALRLYQQRLYHEQAAAAAEPAPPSKGLDNMNDGRPEPKETEEMMVNLECKACFSQLVDTVVLPCGHAILCRWCADQHMPSSRADKTRPKGHATCPMCRKPVKQKVRIPRSHTSQAHVY